MYTVATMYNRNESPPISVDFIHIPTYIARIIIMTEEYGHVHGTAQLATLVSTGTATSSFYKHMLRCNRHHA